MAGGVVEFKRRFSALEGYSKALKRYVTSSDYDCVV